MSFLDFFLPDFELAHESWHAVLHQGLNALDSSHPDYLTALARSSFLPSQHRLFAAFSLPVSDVKYILMGEGPYPREQSATGYCFMDGAVRQLWSSDPSAGLSKEVNRATSLRNFIKMLMVADGQINLDTSGAAIAPLAQLMRSQPDVYVQTMSELQNNFVKQGFLMLNASLVFRTTVAPAVDAKAWHVFLEHVLHALAQQVPKPTLILWGKIADRLMTIPVVSELNVVVSEHPYNLSFIQNKTMQQLFSSFELLHC